MSGVEQVLAAKFTEFGIEPDFNSPLAQFALERLGRLIEGRPGPWIYRTAGRNSPKHPVRKTLNELDRLRAALIACHEASKSHARTDEINACKLFLETVPAIIGHDAFALIEILEGVARSSLETGHRRPDNGPIKLRRDAFILNLFLLVQAHVQPVDLGGNFIDLLDSCQIVLPEGDREKREELLARVSRVYNCNAELFARYPIKMASELVPQT